MVLLNISQQSRSPVYRQIIDGIISMIDQGSLEPETILPSSRNMAKSLGINRSTVFRAYQELLALGYIESTPGSYTKIRDRIRIIDKYEDKKPGSLSWESRSNEPSRDVYSAYLSMSPEKPFNNDIEGFIDLSPLDLDKRLFPVDEFRKSMNTVMVNKGEEILRYGERAGYEPLRESIARRMQLHGISVDKDEILITNGAQQAIDFILRVYTKPGSSIAIEAPTYANVIPLMKYFQVNIISIPMKNDGMDLNILEKKLREDRPSFVYTIPNFQNPTGITTSQVHREKLLSLCEKYETPLIEDGFEEEMKYSGKSVLPIKSMDHGRYVLYLGTFSKVLFPGVRVGWIAAERECIDRMTALKRYTDLSSSNVVQAALDNFCRKGHYDLHIKRMHRVFRKRMQTALRALDNYMPEGIKWTKPDGGYTIWITLKKALKDSNLLFDVLKKNKVGVSPGNFYFHGSNPGKYFRICIASIGEPDIEEGIHRLGNALKMLR